MVGFFDGNKYHCFRSMDDFLRAILVKRYSGWIFFAHFGGRFDVHFVWDHLVRGRSFSGHRLEFFCASSACVSLSVRRSRLRWQFADSYRLMPASLRTLTQEFKVEHQKMAPDFASEAYNESDCRGLYEVLTRYFDGEKRISITVASHSMTVFRSRYLKTRIRQLHKEDEAFVRAAYHGGRCEVFRYDEARVNKYDVVSLYPKAMLENVPTELACRSRDIPADDSVYIGFYEAEVDYPDCYLPALPVHLDKLYFPTGRFRGFFTSMELREALADGARLKILRGRLFYCEPLLREYVLDHFKMKIKAEREGNTGLRFISKLRLNTLYGKFGQRRERRIYCEDDGKPGFWPLPKSDRFGYRFSESRGTFILPHIAAAITSRARIITRRHLLAAGRIYYTDTDSVFTTRRVRSGYNLGDLKFEGTGQFRATRTKEYSWEGELLIKGITGSKRSRTGNPEVDAENERRFQEDQGKAREFLEGSEIGLRRMAGLQESVRCGHLAARYVDTRRHRIVTRDKRVRVGVDTRPWRFDELFPQ